MDLFNSIVNFLLLFIVFTKLSKFSLNKCKVFVNWRDLLLLKTSFDERFCFWVLIFFSFDFLLFLLFGIGVFGWEISLWYIVSDINGGDIWIGVNNFFSVDDTLELEYPIFPLCLIYFFYFLILIFLDGNYSILLSIKLRI